MFSDARALESDVLGLALQTHDLRSLVSPIVQMMDRFSERHPVMLSVPEDPVLVRADADRLQRGLENLVNNAIKYSPAGGAVEVSVVSEGDEAVLRVRDYGIGISQDALPRIFERSFRAPEAAAHAPGVGLGLSIAAQVVAKHGGTISASPAHGGGTCMVVRLPLAHMEDDPAEPRRPAEVLRA
jgi:signal transduction histidine kinase